MPRPGLEPSDRVLFLADQYADVHRDKEHRYPGGAELTDQAVIESAPCSVERRTFETLSERDFEHATVCIVSNAKRASLEQLGRIARFPRTVLFEHDMRVCRWRGSMNTWWRPLHCTLHWCTCRRREMLELTRASAGVVYLTTYQRRIFDRNPWYGRPRARVLGSSVFSRAALDQFKRRAPRDNRSIEVCLSYSASREKGFSSSMKYARRVAREPFVIENLEPDEVLQVFRDARRFVHLPPSPEWAGRLPVEARFMGCEVIANNHVGVVLEPWWSLPDEEALAVLSGAAARFWGFVDELLVEQATSAARR